MNNGKEIKEAAKRWVEQHYPNPYSPKAIDAFLAGARFALELAAQMALIRVEEAGKSFTDTEYVHDYDWGTETVTVDKQSILTLIPE